MISKMKNFLVKRRLKKSMDEVIAYMILVDLVEYDIRELTLLHKVDVRHVLGDNFMSELKKREVKPVRLIKVYMTVIRPLTNLKRQEILLQSNVLNVPDSR